MSYKWFKEWADKSPKTVVLIETHEGFESFGTCATVIFRLTGVVPFRPNKKEKTKEPEVLIPMRDYPVLLDKLNRGHISHLVAREDFKVYSKEFDPRFFDIYATPIENPLKASKEDRIDRGVSVDDRLTVKNLETRKECRWTLVPEAEADVTGREKNGNLSIESEVGNALIGHYVGEDVAVVRGMNDSATYRILLALDAEGHKLKKVKREVVFAETEAESADETAPVEATDTAAPVAHGRASAALMDDDGPVMVFKETDAEETPSEEIASEEIASEEIAAAEERAEETVSDEAETPIAEELGEEPIADEETSVAEEDITDSEEAPSVEADTADAVEEPAFEEEPLAEEVVTEEPVFEETPDAPAEDVTEEATDVAPKKPSFFQRLFGGKAKHKAEKRAAKHWKVREKSAVSSDNEPNDK